MHIQGFLPECTLSKILKQNRKGRNDTRAKTGAFVRTLDNQIFLDSCFRRGERFSDFFKKLSSIVGEHTGAE